MTIPVCPALTLTPFTRSRPKDSLTATLNATLIVVRHISAIISHSFPFYPEREQIHMAKIHTKLNWLFHNLFNTCLHHWLPVDVLSTCATDEGGDIFLGIVSSEWQYT